MKELLAGQTGKQCEGFASDYMPLIRGALEQNPASNSAIDLSQFF